jgi:hypothetical protein
VKGDIEHIENGMNREKLPVWKYKMLLKCYKNADIENEAIRSLET